MTATEAVSESDRVALAAQAYIYGYPLVYDLREVAEYIYEANRETFFAVMGHTTWSSDPAIDALASAAMTLNIQRSLENADGLIDDTPATRAALRAVFALTDEISRRWLDGDITRDQAETFLISSWSHAIREAIPALQTAPKSTASTRGPPDRRRRVPGQ